MGNFTDKYQQVKKEMEDKQRLEEENQKLEAYCTSVVNQTKFLRKQDEGNSYEKTSNRHFYNSTLITKLDPQKQALFDEAAKLIREDKWKTWEIPEKSDNNTAGFRHLGIGGHTITYCLGSYIKTKWADGSIHACGHKLMFEKKYHTRANLLDFVRQRKAINAAYNEMQDYVKMIRNASVGDSRYVVLNYNTLQVILFKDGDVFDSLKRIEKMTMSDFEDWLAVAVNQINMS